jgi:phosphatidylglycerol---prolipoprotein diacylglyceryl transferase
MNIVEFPGLWGLKMTINRVAFEVFGIPIYWYGIIIATGFLLAVLLALKGSKDFGIEPDNILDIALYTAPAAIVSARLFYVIFSWSQFADNPIDIFNTRKGGLAIYGGVIGALIVAFIFARRKKINALNMVDFCIPFVAMAQGIGRWGNFFNQEAFGSATNLPWRMNSETVNSYLSSVQSNLDLKQWGVHPTFLYESLWNFAVFFLLLWFRKKKKLDGEVFFLYMILYGVGRFFIEGLRTDSLMVGNLRISQVLAAAFVIVFTAIFYYRRKKIKRAIEDEPAEVGQSQYSSLLMKLKEEEAHTENKVVTGDRDSVKDVSEEKNDITEEKSEVTGEADTTDDKKEET